MTASQPWPEVYMDSIRPVVDIRDQSHEEARCRKTKIKPVKVSKTESNNHWIFIYVGTQGFKINMILLFHILVSPLDLKKMMFYCNIFIIM